MNYFRWCRARKIRKALRYVRRLEEVLKAIPPARKTLKENEAYQPVCSGGLEDKIVWTEQSQRHLDRLLYERDYLFRKLGIYGDREHRLAQLVRRRFLCGEVPGKAAEIVHAHVA